MTTEKTRAAKRPKQELFVEKAQTAVAKLNSAFRELSDLADKYRGAYTTEQKEAIFSHIEEKLQIPAEEAYNAALAGKAAVTSGFTLAAAPVEKTAT